MFRRCRSGSGCCGGWSRKPGFKRFDQLINAFALQAREKLHGNLRTEGGGALLGLAERLTALHVLDLVALVEEPELTHFGAFPHEVDEPFIGRHEGAARIHHDDESGKLTSAGNVAPHQIGPGSADGFIRLGEAVARKVHKAADRFAGLPVGRFA